MSVLRGTGIIADADYQDEIKWAGKTKGGSPVVIKLKNAVNLENLDWTMQDKGEIVPAITFTATYEEGWEPGGSVSEPWEVIFTAEKSTGEKNPENIALGYGAFYIGETPVGLNRGGGQFVVERTVRNIEADGDYGPVKGRVVIDKSIAKLKMNVLELISENISKLYPGTVIVEEEQDA